MKPLMRTALTAPNSLSITGYAKPRQPISSPAAVSALPSSPGRNATANLIKISELTPVVRDNYTAVLLVCDPAGGIPKTFYSVNGSLGGKLSVNDAGFLEWDAGSIVSAFYSPATSAFTIGGTCKIFRCTFDAEGLLIGQTDTGETEAYRR